MVHASVAVIPLVGEAHQSHAGIREETARELAELQASIAKRVVDAEREDVKAFNTAKTAGWPVEDLHSPGATPHVKTGRSLLQSLRQAPMKKTPHGGIKRSSSGSQLRPLPTCGRHQIFPSVLSRPSDYAQPPSDSHRITT